MTILRALLICTTAFAVAKAHAGDILIIDVNNVVPEIKKIQEYIKMEQAQGRELDTKIVLVPSENKLSLEKRKKIHELSTTKIETNSKFYEDSQCYKVTPDQALYSRCEQTLKILNAARQEKYDLMRGPFTDANRPPRQGVDDGRFSTEEVLTELRQVLKMNYHFSRVFVSGHHSPDPTSGMISGELFAGFKSDQAKEILNAATSTKEVRSFIMLGCWTGRKELMEKAWGQVIPEAKLHFGFTSTAPAKTDPRNLIVLDSILRNEERIGQSHSETELRENTARIQLEGRRIGLRVDDMYLASGNSVQRLQLNTGTSSSTKPQAGKAQ